jgi:hypothetical protein
VVEGGDTLESLEQTMSIERSIRLGVLVLLVAVMVASAPASAQQQKPNVVFILADNVGYGDLGPYGGAARQRHGLTSWPARDCG